MGPTGGGSDPPVVVLADLAHRHQGFQVLVGLVRMDVVKGAAVSRVAVGRREVDGHLQRRQPIRGHDFCFTSAGETRLMRNGGDIGNVPGQKRGA